MGAAVANARSARSLRTSAASKEGHAHRCEAAGVTLQPPLTPALSMVASLLVVPRLSLLTPANAEAKAIDYQQRRHPRDRAASAPLRLHACARRRPHLAVFAARLAATTHAPTAASPATQTRRRTRRQRRLQRSAPSRSRRRSASLSARMRSANDASCASSA